MTYQLPEPAKKTYCSRSWPTPYYTADQMREAYNAGLEVAAKRCELLLPTTGSSKAIGAITDCIRAIRALKEQPCTP